MRLLVHVAAFLSALTLVLGTGGCGSSGDAPRVVVIGLDGLEWDILDPLLARGELPNLQRFVEEGASGVLQSEAPLLSPIIWTTIATGLGPDRHGVLDFTAADPEGGSPIVITSIHRRVKAWWNILDDHGISSGTIGWWATWPAEFVDPGFVVSDRIGYHAFIGEHRPDRSLVYPPTLTERVLSVLRDPDDVGHEEAQAFLEVTSAEYERSQGLDFNDPIRHFRYIKATMDNVARVAVELARAERPTVLTVYFEGIDTAGHTYLKYAPPPHPATTATEREKFGHTVDAFYRHQDRLLGEMMDAIGDQATYILISDHGFMVGEERPVVIEEGREFVEAPRWHHPEGAILALGPGVTPGARLDATIRDIAPTVLALAGIPASEEMEGRVLTEVVAEAEVPDRVPTHEDPDWVVERQATLAASAFDTEIMSRLTALGYIQADGTDAATSARSQVNLGSYFRGRDQTEEAKTAYVDALRIDAENAQANSNLGRLLAQEGLCEEAIPHLEVAWADDPNHLRVAYWLMRCYADADRLDDGIRVGEAITSRFPGELSVTVNLGILYRLAGRTDDAARVFTEILSSHPDHVLSWNQLGDVRVLQGSMDDAILCYRKVLEIEPANPHARERLTTLGQPVDPDDAGDS
jgi:predicted AlkP superfamily phosphohydrolase/phosphomutase/Flp pilus assembly protein TadD